MKKIWFIIIIFCFISAITVYGINYKKNHEIVSCDINRLYSEDKGNMINKWSDTQDITKGILLGKSEETDKSEVYYLYVKNISTGDIAMGPYSYDSIQINIPQTNIGMTDRINLSSQIFRIKPENKELKYIILNGKEYDTESIAIIK